MEQATFTKHFCYSYKAANIALLLQIQRFNTEKQLSTSLISGCKEIMQVRNTIRRLMVRCESISQQMGLVVSRLTKQNGASGGEELRITKQPELLNKE